MFKTRDATSFRLPQSTSTRLVLSFLLLIVIIATVRFQLVVRTTQQSAQTRFALEVREIKRHLLPKLTAALSNPSSESVHGLLLAEVDDNSVVESCQWRAGGQLIEVRSPQPQLVTYPHWFAQRLHIEHYAADLEVPRPDGVAGVLTVNLSPVLSVNQAWESVVRQLWVGGFSILMILGLLAWVLRANRRMHQRLALATNLFKQGQLATRMEVTGSLEARTLAHTFNSMALEVQNLVASLTATQAALQSEKERAEVTLASIGDAVMATDLAGNITSLNAVAEALIGCTSGQALGQPLAKMLVLQNEPGESPSTNPLYQFDSAVHSTNQILLHPSGQCYTVDTTATPIRQTDGTVVGRVLVLRDVTEKRQLIQEMSWQSGHDLLTGLYNRTALEAPFKLAVLQAQKSHKLLAVCLLDLDHFQVINVRHGSVCGDRLLQTVATRLAEFAGEEHTLARLGGDEFVLLLEDQNDLTELHRQVAQLQAQLSAPYQVDNQIIKLTTSIGIALSSWDNPQPSVNLDTLLRHADQAMYQAKQTGRNCAHLFDALHDQEVETYYQQRTRVRQALLDGELRLYFQPKVNMRTGVVFGMESLLRWQHPDKGIVGPHHFLPQVENTDLIIDIGEWVLQHALEEMQRWAALGLDWVVSVNIAARHFHRPDFVTKLGSILAQYPGVSAHRLELEILESAALEDVQHMRHVMADCQQLGVQFALDDFGTGYSSLAYLKRLPVNTLKIDQSFVRDMLEDPDDLTLVQAVVGLAKAFNRQVIAEGVETIEHGLLLLQLGCDLAQGYGISRPMPSDKVLDWAAGYVPAKAWQVSGAIQWDISDFPLLLAERDHRTWVSRLTEQAGQSAPRATITYPDRFNAWYSQQGHMQYGHLPGYAEIAPVLTALHAQGMALQQADTQAGQTELRQLAELQATLATRLTTLLSAAAQDKVRV